MAVDVGAVLTGTEQKDYPSLVTPGAAGFLFQLDNNSIIRFSLYTAGTQTLLNVTIEDDDGNIVAVAVTVFTEESRVRYWLVGIKEQSPRCIFIF